MLGDYGADVIKIERAGPAPEPLDLPPPKRRQSGLLQPQRNKRSVALDLRNAEASRR